VSFVLRIVLLFILAMLVARAFWRLVAGIILGATTPPEPSHRVRRRPPERGVQMVRDPVCGTFLPPASALMLTERSGAVHYFCSETCRGRFEQQSSARK
jgi:YHS domain-containing protein